jgi:uncharacterized membrane protein
MGLAGMRACLQVLRKFWICVNWRRGCVEWFVCVCVCACVCVFEVVKWVCVKWWQGCVGWSKFTYWR